MPHPFRSAATALLVAVLLAMGIAPRLTQGQTSQPSVSVSGPSSVKASAKSIVLNVNVKDVTNLGGFQFVLSFDSSVLKPVSVDKTTFLAGTGRQIFCQDPTIQATAVLLTCVTLRPTPAGVNGSGTIAVVTLKPERKGASAIRLSHVKLVHVDGSTLPSTTVDSKLTVGGGGSWFNWWRITAIAVGVGLLVLVFALLLRRRINRAHGTTFTPYDGWGGDPVASEHQPDTHQ